MRVEGGASAKWRSRHLRLHLPPSTNSAIIYRCVVMYFCTGHGINRIMCVADAERIGA